MLLFSSIILYYREKFITFNFSSPKSIFVSWKKILYIGLPNSVIKIILPFASGVITKLIALYGPETVAGFGVATRIEFFAIIGITSLAVVLGPFVGQNWGAGQFNCIKKGIQFSYQFSFLWGGIAFIILAIFGQYIGALFTDNPRIISVIKLYLLVVPVGYGMYGTLIMATSAMSVFKKPFHATALMFVQTFVFYIPIAYLGSFYIGLWGIFVALPISYFILSIVSRKILNHIIVNNKENALMVSHI